MMFMRYPIDVIWLDSGQRVVDIVRQIPPFNPLKPATWKTYRPSKDAKYVVEIGTSKTAQVSIGDIIEFQPPI